MRDGKAGPVIDWVDETRRRRLVTILADLRRALAFAVAELPPPTCPT